MFLFEVYFNFRVCYYEGRILFDWDEECVIDYDNGEEIEKFVKLFCIKYNCGRFF